MTRPRDRIRKYFSGLQLMPPTLSGGVAWCGRGWGIGSNNVFFSDMRRGVWSIICVGTDGAYPEEVCVLRAA